MDRNGGQRGYDAYSVYLIQEIKDSSYFNILDLTDLLPYSEIDETTEFDWDNKTVLLYYSGGACSSSYETYKRVFSDYPLRDYKFELIKKIDYETWDDDDQYLSSSIVNIEELDKAIRFDFVFRLTTIFFLE